MLAECAACGTRYAPDLMTCPNCWSEERTDGMPKITGAGVSFPDGHAPDDGEEHVHPAVPAEASEPDGAVLPEPDAEPVTEAPAPSAAPPRTPPRRVPPGASGG
jgi:hypothetical protein